MSRFYWVLSFGIAVVVTAWTASAVAQPLPNGPRSGPPFPPLHAAPDCGPPLPPPVALPMPLPQLDAGLPPPPPCGAMRSIPGRPGIADKCLDTMARRAALRTFVRTRLNLNSQQLTAWREFEDVAADGDEEERQACSKIGPRPDGQTMLQRMEMTEEAMSRRLVQIHKLGTPLRKLIATLSPEQQQLLEQSMPAPGL